MKRALSLAAMTLLSLASLPCGVALSASDPEDAARGKELILDGSIVHDVGRVHLNMTNFGLIGSRPSGSSSYSSAPSAAWPGASGPNYLYAAGLWIGALVGGVPQVSTGQFDSELLADPDEPLDVIYALTEGEPSALRFPDPGFDDDGDGLEDEDPRNGLDDDGDGLVDEDAAAIGDQHFRLTMRDDRPLAQEIYPFHAPMGLEVIQDSYQWAGDDFVGFDVTVTNVGVQVLEDLVVGIFLDPDIPALGSDFAVDDRVGSFTGSLEASDGSRVPVKLGYAFDDDGDGGTVPGRIGALFLDFPTDIAGEVAPARLSDARVNFFQGRFPVDLGGDPTNDAERYVAMISEDDVPPAEPDDIRVLVSAGPFGNLVPGESLRFSWALVLGEDDGAVRRTAGEAALRYWGAYFDRDGDPATGVGGRDLRICQDDFGPPGPDNPIFSIFADCVEAEDFEGPDPPAPIGPEDLDEDGCIFINSDCLFERTRGAVDCEREGEPGVTLDDLAGCTGIGGREHNVRWWRTDGVVPAVTGRLRASLRDDGAVLVDVEVWNADGLAGGGDVAIHVERRATSILPARSWERSVPGPIVDDDPGAGRRDYDLLLASAAGTVVLDRITVTVPSRAIESLRIEAAPNPFNPRVNLDLDIPVAGLARLTVHDARGRQVRTLLVAPVTAGSRQLLWDGKDSAGRPVASGVYVVRLEVAGRSVTRSITLAR